MMPRQRRFAMMLNLHRLVGMVIAKQFAKLNAGCPANVFNRKLVSNR